MKNRKQKKWFLLAGTGLILTMLLVVMVGGISLYQKKMQIENSRYVLAGEINKLQYAIDSRLLNAEILEMIVVNGDGLVKDFDKIAERLYVDDPALRSLQLAPDGVVSYVYPLAGNEDAFGDLFSDPDRKTEAEYARDTGQMTLAGPYELSQGGMGAVARRPIYLADESGERQFWGFSVVILNVPELFDKSGLEALDQQGYFYELWRIHPDTGEKQVILENGKIPDQEALFGTVTVPGGSWTLDIYPKKGWVWSRNIWMECGVGAVMILLMLLVLNGMINDKRQREELAELANTDPLTGLKNERYLMDTLKKLVQEKKPFVLYYLDMDHFKEVNDRFGHDVGDRFLVEVALRMKQCLGDKAMSFRIGGDEFTAIARGGETEQFYAELKERMKEEIGRPFLLEEGDIRPRASIGYASYPSDSSELETLIRKADQSMYQEKNAEKERDYKRC